MGGVKVPEVSTVPFMYQRTFWPDSECRQRMSGLPSMSKSPVPTIFQRTSASAAGVVNVPPRRFQPFMNQTTFWPSVACRQRKSGLPSALKSLVPTIIHRGSDSGGGAGRESAAV